MRSQFSTVEEMNEKIIQNLFETVKPNDNLYFLGDIGWGFPEHFLEDFFLSLKKHKVNFHWIEGNHDSSIKIDSSAIKWRGAIKDIVIEKQPITLCHYPMVVWNKSHYNAIQLHGHIHYGDNTFNALKHLHDNYSSSSILRSRRLNVNIEFWRLHPVSFEEVVASMTGKENFDLVKVEDSYGVL